MIAVLGKKYTNPSSDIIDLLAGLDHIDTVFAEFVAALESLIRNGRSNGRECCPNGIGHVGQEEPRSPGNKAGCTYTADLQQRAVEVALAVTSGAYQTSLLTYFIQRDLFLAMINVSKPTQVVWSVTGKADSTVVHAIANSIHDTQDNITLHAPWAPSELQQV
jgi:hypothetical protein